MENIAPDIYVSMAYPGVNVGFVALPAGAVLIDVPVLPRDVRAWREEVEQTAGGPVLYAVLTDAHPDRLIGAGLLDVPIVAARGAYDRAVNYTSGYRRSAVETWAGRYPQAADDLVDTPFALPEVLFTDHITLHGGGRSVTIERVDGGAPGSAWVRFREHGVLFVGDLVVVDTHPYLEAVVDSKAWLNTLTTLRRKRYAGTTIVPGRGSICEPSDTRPVSEYIVLARRRARSLCGTDHTRVDKAAAVTELMAQFPVAEEAFDFVQRRVKAGLDQLCDELEEGQA